MAYLEEKNRTWRFKNEELPNIISISTFSLMGSSMLTATPVILSIVHIPGQISTYLKVCLKYFLLYFVSSGNNLSKPDTCGSDHEHIRAMMNCKIII
jgi:hypothetical protein